MCHKKSLSQVPHFKGSISIEYVSLANCHLPWINALAKALPKNLVSSKVLQRLQVSKLSTLRPGYVIPGTLVTLLPTSWGPNKPCLNISTVRVTLLCGTLQIEEAFTFTARTPYLKKTDFEIWACAIWILQGGFGFLVESKAFAVLDAIPKQMKSETKIIIGFLNFVMLEDRKLLLETSKVIHRYQSESEWNERRMSKSTTNPGWAISSREISSFQ